MIPAQLWDQLAGRDSEAVTRCASVRAEADGSYTVPVLHERYRVDPNARDVRRLDPPEPAKPDFQRWLATVVYLLEAGDVEPSGTWVSPRSLPGARAFFRGPHEIPVDRIVRRFGAARDDFEAACRRCGGTAEAHADVAYAFRVFPRLPVAVLLWLADDEFPARASMLVDSTADRHLPPDALWSALHVLQRALLAAAPA